MLKLTVLYPQPTDVEKFEKDYQDHLLFFHEKTGIPTNVKPYKVTRMFPTPNGIPEYYVMFSMPFDSAEALQGAMASPGMQDIAADAARISSGGAPVVLVGNEE